MSQLNTSERQALQNIQGKTFQPLTEELVVGCPVFASDVLTEEITRQVLESLSEKDFIKLTGETCTLTSKGWQALRAE